MEIGFSNDLTRPNAPILMVSAEAHVLASMTLPTACRTELNSTVPMERVDGGISGRADVAGTCPDEDAIPRILTTMLIEQSDEWVVQRSCYITLESIASIGDDDLVNLATTVG